MEGHEGDLSKGHHGHWTKCEGARTENARSENISTFQKEPNPVPVDPPIRGSVKAAHMRGFIRADDAWEPFRGVSHTAEMIH